MKLSENWLREHANPGTSTEQLAEQLTMAGFEIDAVLSCQPRFSGVVVGRVVKISPHPGADRQRICEVQAGSGVHSVVCGADNIEVGQCYPLALPGAVLPGDKSIQRSAIKGVESEGMLCSANELGLAADADKLFELQEDAEPGRDLAAHLQLDDKVLDISLTPNRGDCFSIAGIAREIGVLNDLEPAAIDYAACMESIESARDIRLQAGQACPRYAGRVIRGIDIGRRVPDFILERLRRADIRSINSIVDLTNYVMLETGQPMHAFDNDKLSGGIDVRWSKPGEALTLLDGQELALGEHTLLITDGSGPVALAGIMGGLDTAVSHATQDIFLESAFFSQQAIAGRARSYGLHTDASLRYERGVDVQLQEKALQRLSGLVLEYCGGKAGPLTVAEEAASLPSRAPVKLSLANVEKLLGVRIDAARARKILALLGFSVQEDEQGFMVGVPSWRFDISLEADLIEEIARIVGYDSMPSVSPQSSLTMFGGSGDEMLQDMQQCLVHRGYHEIISYSFVDRAMQDAILGPLEVIPLLNPISSDLAVMRCSLLPGLVGAMKYNQNRQQERLRLFEVGRVFNDAGVIRQDLKIGGLITGNIYKKQWGIKNISSSLYDIKNDISALLQLGRGQDEAEYRAFAHQALHPGQSAEIFVENQSIGFAGALHPRLMTALDLGQPAYVFELDLSLISRKKGIKFTKVSKFPVVKRDISLLVDKDIEVARLLDSVKNAAEALLDNLELFDLYQGEGIDPRKKSLALGLTFQTSSSTLTEEEVESVMKRIMDALHSEFGATLRE